MNDRYRKHNTGEEDPPHSRLFILASRDLSEEDIRKEFEAFGSIKDLKAVKDRNTGENKGIFYVTYYKTSEAAKALENMKGKFLANRAIKVMIASSREQGNAKGDNEEEHVKRLFIVVPKTVTDSEIINYFKEFGDVEYANIVKDKNTNQSKGFAYVKYFRFSDAATALERCDKKYKAVFAQPRKPKEELQKRFQNNLPMQDTSYSGEPNFSTNFNEDGTYMLHVIAPHGVNQDQMWKLFDLVPSMDYCQVIFDLTDQRNRPANAFEVVYTNYEWAAYALEKFHGFEYPPGQRLIVKADHGELPGPDRNILRSKRSSSGSGGHTPLTKLAETIAQASSLIQKAGISSELLPSGQKSDSTLCNKPLPPRQPMADIDATSEARCFVICVPTTLPQKVLEDVFCRFGNLIDIYMLNNRTYGYANYTSKESAEEAIRTLHGVDVLGVRLKVVEAEERPVKRQRLKPDDSVW